MPKFSPQLLSAAAYLTPGATAYTPVDLGAHRELRKPLADAGNAGAVLFAGTVPVDKKLRNPTAPWAIAAVIVKTGAPGRWWKLNDVTAATAAAISAASGWKGEPGPTPVPTPGPGPTPIPGPGPTPGMARIVADPHQGQRPVGVKNKNAGPFVLDSTAIEGFSHNIVVQNAASATLTNVRSINAFANPGQAFGGQGIYAERCGVLKLRNCIFMGNGWHEGLPLGKRGPFAHGVYSSYGVTLDVADCIFACNSNFGLQSRGLGGTIRNCLFVDNGGAIASAMGPLTISDSLILGGRYYWQSGVWTGMNGGWINWPTTFRNVTFAATVNQYLGDNTVRQSGARTVAGAAVVASTIPKKTLQEPGHHDWHTPGTTDLIDAQGCVIRGWRVPFGGDLMDRQNFSGFEVRPDPVDANYADVVQQALAGGDVAGAIAAVRALAG